MNNKEIRDRLYFFFPRNVDCYDPKYQHTLEHLRLKAHCALFDSENEAFTKVLEHTNRVSPTVDYTAFKAWDRCYRIGTYISDEIGLLTSISIIAPFYIFQTFFTDGSQREPLDLAGVSGELLKQISTIITKFYPGYRLLDMVSCNIPINDISLPRSGFGEVTLAKAIFTDHTI